MFRVYFDDENRSWCVVEYKDSEQDIQRHVYREWSSEKEALDAVSIGFEGSILGDWYSAKELIKKADASFKEIFGDGNLNEQQQAKFVELLGKAHA